MKSAIKLLIYMSLVVFGLNSCITSKDTNLMQDIDKDYSTVPPPEEYKIIPGDQLQISVYIWDDEESKNLFSEYMPSRTSQGEISKNTGGANDMDFGGRPTAVYADGTIKFPYIGRIYVEGLTLLETRKLITARLQAISNNASAEVRLYNRYFSVIGESGARRITMLKTSMTIYQALSTAGYIGDYSQRNRVNIIRQTNEGSKLKTFDLRTKDIINTEYYYIQPNDVIYFPQSKGKFFGASTSFVGFFGLITSFLTILVMAFRLF